MKPELLVSSQYCAIAAAVLTIIALLMKRSLAKKGAHADDSCFTKDYGLPMCSGTAFICLILAAITLYLGLGFKM